MHISNYDIIRKSWNGIEIEIRWNPDHVALDDGSSMAHLEIESLDRSPLPVTETGYRSHFIHEAEVAHYGGAEAYVDAWFAAVMFTPQGRNTYQAARQLPLF